MAAIKHASGVKLLIKVEDTPGGGVYSTYCTINAERGITFTAGMSETDQIDCATPEEVAWVLREKTNLSASITGSGTVNTPDVGEFFDWLIDTASRSCKVILDVPGADGGVIFTGNFHLNEFSLTGNRGEKAQASTSLSSDGEIAKTANT